MGTCEHSNRTLLDKKSKGGDIKLLDILSRGRSSQQMAALFVLMTKGRKFIEYMKGDGKFMGEK